MGVSSNATCYNQFVQICNVTESKESKKHNQLQLLKALCFLEQKDKIYPSKLLKISNKKTCQKTKNYNLNFKI